MFFRFLGKSLCPPSAVPIPCSFSSRSPSLPVVRTSVVLIWLPLCLGFLFATSCASSEGPEPAAVGGVSSTEPAAAVAVEQEPASEQASEEEINSAIASVDDKVEEDDAPHPAVAAETDEISHVTTQKIPLELNDEVQKWLDFFVSRDKERFQRFMERGEKYRPQIMAVLADQGVPEEIYYQAMIESGFATAATSRARAVGVWQFMPATGRRYGLRVDSYVDERRDPYRSTIAAALYLKDLYNVFQSWYLAMAAYNAGEGRIMNAIMRAKTRDFWAMVRMHALPEETLNYIPKFLAATTIGHNPKHFGFEPFAGNKDAPLVSIAVPSPIRLADLANATAIPLDELKTYNPHLIRSMTPPGVSSYRVWVTKEQAGALEGHEDRLAALRVPALRDVRSSYAVTGDAAGRPTQHVVRRGETLAKIAGLYGLSVRRLKRMNHLRSSRLAPGSKLKLIGVSDIVQVPTQVQYRVRRGDSLHSIARHFGVSVTDLKRINRLRRANVAVGQLLTVEHHEG